MSSKSTIMVFMIVGSTVGSLIPMIWGATFFDTSSVILTAVGGAFGIWLGLRISN
ncbi:MAG: hypothetical protein WCI91_01595 [Candidatus Nomurabacteria bacterium]